MSHDPPPHSRQSINFDNSDMTRSQVGQGTKVTQIQAERVTYISIWDFLSVDLPEYIESFERRIIGASIVFCVATLFFSRVVFSLKLVGLIGATFPVFATLFVGGRIVVRYFRNRGTFWADCSKRERDVINRYLDKIQSDIKENFEYTFDPDKNYVSLSGDVYPHQAYEEKAPRFRRQIRNLDAYILSPINERVFIYGPPGSGKSTTLYKIFLTYKLRCFQQKSKYIPIFIHANQISQIISSKSPNYADINHFLLQIYQQQDGSNEVAEFVELLRSKQKINLVLIVDALDEFVDKTKRQDLFNYLDVLIEKTSQRGTKWILSCREEEYSSYSTKLNVANVKIRPMNLNQVEEFLDKRLKTLRFDDEGGKTIRYQLIAIARAGNQGETFLKNPYYLALWLWLLATSERSRDPFIPSIDELHIYELKREMAKGMGESPRDVQKVDDVLTRNIISVLSVLSFSLLRLSLQTDVNQGIALSDLSIVKELARLIIPIEEQAYDVTTRRRLERYSSLVAGLVTGNQKDLGVDLEDGDFINLLTVVGRAVFKNRSALHINNDQSYIQFTIIFVSLIEQAYKNRLIELDAKKGLFFRFLNQRAGDYLAACFLRKTGLSTILQMPTINFWLFRAISIALASSENPQAILDSLREIPSDYVFENAIVNGLILLPSNQRNQVEGFILRLTRHLLDEQRLLGTGTTYDPCEPLRALRQIRQLCMSGYSDYVKLPRSLFQKLLNHSDLGISEAATITLLIHACQVRFNRKLWGNLLGHFLQRALRFEYKESSSSFWLTIKDTQR